MTYAPSLKQRTTLRLGGSALAEVLLDSDEQFERLPGLMKKLGGRPLPLGRGSNILAQDGELGLVLLRLDERRKPDILEQDDCSALVFAPAGLPLPALLNWAARQGLGGLEGLAGIPGTVGGAIAMNAGSYGSEIGSYLNEAEFFSPEHGLFRKKRDELFPAYRHFSFDGQAEASWHLIRSALLRLPRRPEETIRAEMQENFQKKQAGQPLQAASAGCAFKNPSPEFPAGMLLDKCGFKGRELGGMLFSPTHANFLVNRGDGTSSQALELIELARIAVKNEFGFDLELEIRVVP
ncbi:MAG: UDP-N-acetylmuramate dehydrogenase [Desulfovibrionaceae bacterium]|nr:UDP-N-acetylmuramate dehydrogenase [Desulfovibrionaceae bacterium]